MSKKNKVREINLTEKVKDTEFELWESDFLIGRINKIDSKYEYSLNGKDTSKMTKDLDGAINELLLQYNLHAH